MELFANELLQNNKITDLVNTYGTKDSKNIIINTNTEYCTFDDITIFKSYDNFENDNIYTIAGNLSDNNLVCYITITYTNNEIVLSKIEVIPK